MIKNKVQVTIEGLNQNNFLSCCQTNKIGIKNYMRLSKSKSSFQMSLNDFYVAQRKQLFQFFKTKYRFISGPIFALTKITQNIGFVLGFIVVFVAIQIASQKVLKINIKTKSPELKEQIIQQLIRTENTVGKNWKDINLKEIESGLFSEIRNASNVSVIKDGCVLKITASNAQITKVRNENIVAPEDCVVEYLQVAKGTAKVEQGNIAKKGQVIVEMVNGETCATVKIRLFHQASVAISQFMFKKERTGECVQRTKLIWPWQEQSFDFCCNYEEYEKEIEIVECSNAILLPIKKVTITYHQLKLTEVNEQQALKNAKAKAQMLATSEFTSTNKLTFEIRETNGQKFVDCFAEAVIEL